MADIKISGLASKGANVASTDLLVISEFVSGSTYTSKKITGAELKNSSLIFTTNSTYNFSLTDANTSVFLADGSSVIARIPNNTSVAFPIGTRIEIIQNDAGQVQVVPVSGVTLKSEGAKDKTAAQYSQATLLKGDTNTWYLFGDITT